MKKILSFSITLAVVLGTLVVLNSSNGPEQQQSSPRNPTMPRIDPPNPNQNHTFETAKESIKEEEIRQQMVYLTSNELQGRMSGMQGNVTAGEYLSQWMKTHGVPGAFNGSYYQIFPVRKENEFKEKSNGKTANIIGCLPGNDPVLKDEIIIVGAHMDHIGYGPQMSSSPNRREIHPGADDNATGTCVVMSCVKGFSLLKGKNKRTIVFMHFSGEEMGLVGARYYCQNPIWNHEKTFVMINQDMVGRLKGQTTLTASGAAAVPAIGQVVKSITGYPFTGRPTSDTGGGSDHAAFAQKRVPVICFHTGQHSQYHTPDDDVSRIDMKGLHSICQYVFELAWKIDKLDGKAAQVQYYNIDMSPNSKKH